MKKELVVKRGEMKACDGTSENLTAAVSPTPYRHVVSDL